MGIREEAIEAAMEAIWTAPLTGQPVGQECRSYPPEHAEARVELRLQATAAVDAFVTRLQDPSEEMVTAGDEAHDAGGWTDGANPTSIFRAMLEPLGKRG